MNQKHFTIAFIAITVLAVLGLGYSKLSQGSLQVIPSPSPSVNSLLSNQNESGNSGQTTQQLQQAQSAKKPLKQYPKYPGDMSQAQLTDKKAMITTSKGIIEFEIYPEATKAASNFIFLANDKFYDGLTFHRVEPGFVIQGGDPSGNGTGGPGYKFADEPVTRSYDRGIVAMANSGPNTNGSQFFIMLEDNSTLPPNYTIFGKVTKGQDVVNKIRVGDVMQSVVIGN